MQVLPQININRARCCRTAVARLIERSRIVAPDYISFVFIYCMADEDDVNWRFIPVLTTLFIGTSFESAEAEK